MKRLLLIIGFLLLPVSVSAQSALSPWVREVLNRVDEGIGVADSQTSNTGCDNASMIGEIQENLSIVRQASQAVVALEAEAESLRSRTVCYENDRLLLQKKMKDITDAMQAAVEACDLGKSRWLRDVYAFLAESYASFLFGGTNPSYKDNRLWYRYPFHDLSLTEPEFDSGSTLPLCAFTSDYAPHSIAYPPTALGVGTLIGPSPSDVKSYGCDLDVLNRVASPLDSEAGVLRDFITRSDTFARDIYTIVSRALLNMNEFLAQISGQPISGLPGPVDPPPHETVSGCLRPDVPDPSSSEPEEWEQLLLAYPEYFDHEQGNKDPGTNEITFGARPGEELPVGLLFHPIMDSFRTMPASLVLLRTYIDRRADAGVSRPLPVAFVNEKLDSYVSVMHTAVDSRNSLRGITANMEQALAYYDGIGRDSIDGMREASKPLSDAVDSLVYVTSEFLPGNADLDSPSKKEEGYIPQLTYFLARSCVDGHCPETLDAIAKRIHNPFCRPYVSGVYLNEDTHKRCYCDPSVQGTWGDFEKYCSSDFSSEQSRYDAMEPILFPGCTEENQSSSSSFSSSPTP